MHGFRVIFLFYHNLVIAKVVNYLKDYKNMAVFHKKMQETFLPKW